MRWFAYLPLYLFVATDLEAKQFVKLSNGIFKRVESFLPPCVDARPLTLDVRVKPEVQSNEEALELHHQQ